MKSAEQIFENYKNTHYEGIDYIYKNEAVELMNEYAEQVAIDFAIWKDENRWIKLKDNSYFNQSNYTTITASQLFLLYKTEKGL